MLFRSRNVAVKKLIALFLLEHGIHSISLNPDTVLKTTLAILDKESSLRPASV